MYVLASYGYEIQLLHDMAAHTGQFWHLIATFIPLSHAIYLVPT